MFMKDINKKYWDKYYNKKLIPEIPSQFSAFVASELMFVYKIQKIVEFGSGNFRDSNFFAKNNFNIVAVDPSGKLEQKKSLKIKFCKTGFKKFFDEVFKVSKTPICFYGRFFLHAISKENQVLFFKILRNKIKKNDIVALEFRIDKDKKLKKETAKHYRDFISTDYFENTLIKKEFKILYKVSGTGFAKYKSDNAYIARYLIKIK